MDKLSMRVYLSDLETRIDTMLKKWKKESRIENGEAVQVEWQFEQAHVIIDVFWEDLGERIILHCFSPRFSMKQDWAGLNAQTAVKVMDRVGNFVQIAMGKQRR